MAYVVHQIVADDTIRYNWYMSIFDFFGGFPDPNNDGHPFGRTDDDDDPTILHVQTDGER